jgi:NDP-hexose-3,4-dehydratase
MFSGKITAHPTYVNSEYRLGSPLEESDYILRQSFWIGIHPRMTEADRMHIIKTFNDFFNNQAPASNLNWFFRFLVAKKQAT